MDAGQLDRETDGTCNPVQIWMAAGDFTVHHRILRHRNFLGDTVNAQDRGSLEPAPLPPLAHPGDPKTPAKELFARKATPAPMQTRSIGFDAKGCLAGAVALPITARWQVMRLFAIAIGAMQASWNF